jgi:hypothetical protein
MENSPALNTHPAHSEERAPFHRRGPIMKEYPAEMPYLKRRYHYPARICDGNV